MTNPPPLPSGFKDRKIGLGILGILTLLAGGLCALLIPLLIFSSKAGGGAPNSQFLLPAIFMYGALAVALIWLGVGSMMARRWARALLLIFSWAALITGVLGIAAFAVMVPKFLSAIHESMPAGQPTLPAFAQQGILIMMFAVLGFLFLVLPGIWVLFYGSKNVKATCEARDPVERWTDRCPLPVLALSLMLLFGGASILMNMVSLHGVLPFFGMLLSGPLGMAAWALFAAFWVYLAWSVYHLDLRGWWLTFLSMALFAISSFLTYSRHNMTEVYQLAGYPQDMIERMQQINFLHGNSLAWLTLLSFLPWLVYLLFVRKFFRRPA